MAKNFGRLESFKKHWIILSIAILFLLLKGRKKPVKTAVMKSETISRMSSKWSKSVQEPSENWRI